MVIHSLAAVLTELVIKSSERTVAECEGEAQFFLYLAAAKMTEERE